MKTFRAFISSYSPSLRDPDKGEIVVSEINDVILGWLAVATIVALGGAKALHTAWTCRLTLAWFRHHITQRTRYVMLGFSLACTIPTICIFTRYGINNVFHTLDLTIKADPYYGWAVATATIIAILDIPLTFVGALCVRKWPSPFAFRKGDLYVPTVLRRRGVNSVVYRPGDGIHVLGDSRATRLGGHPSNFN